MSRPSRYPHVSHGWARPPWPAAESACGHGRSSAGPRKVWTGAARFITREGPGGGWHAPHPSAAHPGIDGGLAHRSAPKAGIAHARFRVVRAPSGRRACPGLSGPTASHPFPPGSTRACPVSLRPWNSTRAVGACAHACVFTQSYPSLCDPVDCSPPGSSVRAILRQEHGSGLPSSRALPTQGRAPVPALQAATSPGAPSPSAGPRHPLH